MLTNHPVFGNTFSKMTNPPLKCHPLKPRTIVMSSSPVDISPLNFMPIEGHRWIVNFYFLEANNGRYLGCFNSEAIVTLSSSRGARGRG